MPYIKTIWSNEVPAASPVRYTIRDSDGNVISDDVTIEVKTSITPGTPLDATNLNKIEQGIYDAMAAAEAPITTAKLVDGILTADATGRAKMADGFITLAKMAAGLKFQKIAEFVGDGSAQLDFTSIPADFTHLLLIYSGKSTGTDASGYDGFGLRCNGDELANYASESHFFYDNKHVGNLGAVGLNTGGLYGGILMPGAAAYQPGSGFCLIPNYKGTAHYKTAIELSFFYPAMPGIHVSTSVWQNVAAITRLTGYMGAGLAPAAGSVFSLYGFD